MAITACLKKVYGPGLWLTAILMISACAGVTPPPQRETGLPAPEMVSPPASTGHADDSRRLASYSLIREGYELLAKNNFEGAIRVLERAVGINPADGQGYYYLAEAWLGKADFELAARFNDLAGLYLRDNPVWSRRVLWQKERIEKGPSGP